MDTRIPLRGWPQNLKSGYAYPSQLANLDGTWNHDQNRFSAKSELTSIKTLCGYHMPETSIITIANQKGGVGKTTTVVNLAQAYASMGKRVCVIDVDYQANATALLGGTEIAKAGKTLTHALDQELHLDDVVEKTKFENISLVAADRQLDSLREKLNDQPHRTTLFNFFLNSKETRKFDVIIFDTHPSLDCYLQSALAASHYYLIPLFAEPDSTSGLAHQISAVEKVRRHLNPMLMFLGCVITRYEKTNATHVKFQKYIRDLSLQSNFNVFETTIPVSQSVTAASAHSLPLAVYKKNLPVAMAYATLAGEILPYLKGKRKGRQHTPADIQLIEKHTSFELSPDL